MVIENVIPFSGRHPATATFVRSEKMKRMGALLTVLALLAGSLALTGCNMDNVRDSVNKDIDKLVDAVTDDD